MWMVGAATHDSVLWGHLSTHSSESNPARRGGKKGKGECTLPVEVHPFLSVLFPWSGRGEKEKEREEERGSVDARPKPLTPTRTGSAGHLNPVLPPPEEGEKERRHHSSFQSPDPETGKERPTPSDPHASTQSRHSSLSPEPQEEKREERKGRLWLNRMLRTSRQSPCQAARSIVFLDYSSTSGKRGEEKKRRVPSRRGLAPDRLRRPFSILSARTRQKRREEKGKRRASCAAADSPP